MTYQIILLEADIRDPIDGNMLLGLNQENGQMAKLEYSWDAKKFTAIFHGHATNLPVPAHPTTLLQAPIVALQEKMTDKHRLITDVFQDHQITIVLDK